MNGRIGKIQLGAAWVVVALATAFACPGVATAQNGAQEELRAYIERTDELQRWAASLIDETGSEQARLILEQGRLMQERSREMMNRGRMVEAFSVARRARDVTWQAVRLAREAAGLDERIRLRSERFMDQHSQLTDRARDAGDERVLDLLQRSREQAQRARERFQQGDLQLAMKLLEQAEDLLRRAARLLADGVGPERLRNEIDRTRNLVAEARERLAAGASPGALALIADAEEASLAAEEALADRNPGRALQMAGLARRLAQRALGQSEQAPDGVAVTRLTERFDSRAGDIQQRVRGSGSDQAARTFERARVQRDGAAQALAEGKVEMALRQVRAAHDLLDQTERLLR